MNRHDPRVADLVTAGRVRSALFLPQFTRDPATGELIGHGTGYIGIALTQLFAGRLGIAAEVIGEETPAIVVDSLKSGAIDMAFLGIEPRRAAELDFTPAIFEFDFSFLVPAGSDIAVPADVDRSGKRIAVAGHHASTIALAKIVRHAELRFNDVPEQAFEMLRAGGADAFAFPRDVLDAYCKKLPGSRVLETAYGVNRAGIAIRKGQAGRLALLGELVAEAKASGEIQRIIERGGLRHFRVAQ